MCNIFTKFITVSEVLVVPELFYTHFEKRMWLTLVTYLRQIPEAIFLQLLSKFHVNAGALKVVRYV
jgi:protein associated with RNAse G/E